MAFEPPTVVLDANLLYPFLLRNLLVQLGVDLLLQPHWTGRIHEEWIGSLAATGKVTRERLERTRDLMDRVLPGANVLGWERRLADVPGLPDPGDRHVVAVALAAPAPTILTLNLRDFPAAVLTPLKIAAEHPDPFLRGTLTFAAFVDAFERHGLPTFAARMRAG